MTPFEGFGIPGFFKRHLPQGLGLAKLFKRHPPRAFGQRTPYDVQIALDAQETRIVLSNTLRMEFRPAGEGHSTPQGRWFCARSFQTAVGSRLKDPEASDGLV